MEPNYVYVMRLNDWAHKIGISVDPQYRACQLTQQHGCAVSVVYVWHRELGDAVAVESIAHRLLAPYFSLNFAGREIFNVTAESACHAVELAAALHRDAVITIERHLPIKASSLLADMADLSVDEGYFGYVDFSSQDMTPNVLAMRQHGVKSERVYNHLGACSKAMRSGDTLLVTSPKNIDVERFLQRGINVRVI